MSSPGTPPAPTPRPMSGARPAPPVGGVGASVAAPAPGLPDLPEVEQLAQMTIREHVTLFEDLNRTLADRLDDTGS